MPDRGPRQGVSSSAHLSGFQIRTGEITGIFESSPQLPGSLNPDLRSSARIIYLKGDARQTDPCLAQTGSLDDFPFRDLTLPLLHYDRVE